MGKGDIKTKKGKRHIGSFGKHRPHRPPAPPAGGEQKKSRNPSKEEQKSS